MSTRAKKAPEQHTPGPWHRNIPPARKYPTVWAGRNTHVAAVVAGAPRGSGNGKAMSDAEIEANINLIAAAPDLLAALLEIEKICVESSGDCRKRMGTRVGNALVTARTAIAKAQGGEA